MARSGILTRRSKPVLFGLLAGLLFCVGGLAPVPLQAQSGGSNPLQSLQGQFEADSTLPSSSAELVSVEARLARTPVPAGSEVRAAVVLDVKEGWHVNAHEPTLDYLIGTTIEWESQPGLMVNQVQYPDPTRLSLDFAGEELDVYEGRSPVFLTLRPASSTERGERRLTGRLRVQACNDQTCLRPSTINVTVPVPVSEPGAETTASADTLFDSFTTAQASSGGKTQGASLQLPTSAGEVAALFQGGGMILGFGIIFLVGLALNLTPCVYPMLSVTVSLFGGQEDTNPARAFGRASLYVGGIVTMYSALGVLAAYTGQLFGGWLQSMWVTGGIGALLVVLAASMFGAFQLQLPASVQTRLGGAQQAAGPLGTYASGLLVGVVAAPCIGPPVIAVLAFVGREGDPMLGLATMTVMALGLGLPYLLLGTFSGLITRLPQSGTWMVHVKKIFGFVLLGAGLFYLGLATVPDWAYHAVPLALAGAGGYFAVLAYRTVMRPSGPPWRTVQVTTTLASVVALGGALWFVQFLQADGVAWTSYSEDVLAKADAQDRPVVLDFTADWCIPCQELDRITFTDGEVKSAMQNVEPVKVDLTEAGTPRTERLRKEYDVAGVPTIVFLNGDGEEVESARTVGFIRPTEFVKRLRKLPSMDEGGACAVETSAASSQARGRP